MSLSIKSLIAEISTLNTDLTAKITENKNAIEELAINSSGSITDVVADLNNEISRATQAESLALNYSRKSCFCQSFEAEGLLSVGEYPFSLGCGSPSVPPNFGFFIPFDCVLVGYSISRFTSDTGSVNFAIERLSPYTSGNLSTVINLSLSGSEKERYQGQMETSIPKGKLFIKCTQANGLTDITARYRISIFFQSIEYTTSLQSLP
jgi:hypothetical protein